MQTGFEKYMTQQKLACCVRLKVKITRSAIKIYFSLKEQFDRIVINDFSAGKATFYYRTMSDTL